MSVPSTGKPKASFRIALPFLAAASAFALEPSPRPPPPGNPPATQAAGAVPRYAEARLPDPAPGSSLAKASADARDRALAREFLAVLAPRFRASPAVGGPSPDFRLGDPDREAARSADQPARVHFTVRQFAGGLPVFGGEGRVALRDRADARRAVYTGRFRRLPASLPSLAPALDAARATAAARADLARHAVFAPFDPELAGPPAARESAPELVLYPIDPEEGDLPALRLPRARAGDLRLAWHVAVRPNLLELWEVVVDARDGAVLEKYPAHCTGGPAFGKARDLRGVERTFGTWQHTDNRYYLIDAGRPMFDAARSRFPDAPAGAVLTMDMANSRPSSPVYRHLTSADNAWTNPTAVSAHAHAVASYEYFLKVHGRNSINGLGGTIRSFINVVGPDGLAMDNAYWNGNAMFYGNGRTLMTPLAGSLDVSGHELTHGVVGATAALRYRGQSGAINESMADIFGAMIEREDWRIGEDVVKRAVFTTGAMRDMANPNQGLIKGGNGWQPAHMTEFLVLPVTEAGDWGGVHSNSGIPNKAFVLFAEKVTKEVAEKVYYRSLTRYLTASSQFADLRQAVVLAARDLQGDAVAKAAEDAFAAVGIGPPATIVPKVNVLNPNTGAQQVLLTRAGAGDGNTLYLADSAFGNPRPLTRTALRFKPSVSDDGSTVLFVSKEGRIVKVSTDPDAPGETVVQADPVWSLVAISKDGLRFAATKASRDTAIYVGSLAGGEIRRFPLYRPDGLGVRTAVFAGSLDWDHAGESVLYDVFNRIRGADGSSIEYWDVGLVRVWDRAGNRFAESSFLKPFGDLADGYSAGNPAFARNSPDVVVYEYFAPDGGISLMARDIETRNVGTLGTNVMVGYPSFDKHDAGVAYATLQGGDTVIAWQPLRADKLSPAGAPRVVATAFKWPVFLARGPRPATPIAPKAQAAASGASLRARSRGAGLRLEVLLPGRFAGRISLHGIDGRLLVSRPFEGSAGLHRVDWSPSTGTGAGVGFVRLEGAGLRLTARVLGMP